MLHLLREGAYFKYINRATWFSGTFQVALDAPWVLAVLVWAIFRSIDCLYQCVCLGGVLRLALMSVLSMPWYLHLSRNAGLVWVALSLGSSLSGIDSLCTVSEFIVFKIITSKEPFAAFYLFPEAIGFPGHDQSSKDLLMA